MLWSERIGDPMARKESIRPLAWMAALTGLYFAAGKLGLALAFLHPSASPVWPPSGIALAAMLLLGYRLWPAVYLGAFLVNVTTAGSVTTALGTATGNTLETLLGAYLVNRFANGRNAFDQPEDSIKFVFLAALLSTTLSATIGVTSLALGGYAPWREYAGIWLTWWLGDAVSVLVVTPFLVLWSEIPRLRWQRSVSLEAALLLLVLLLVGWFVFVAPGPSNYPIVYLYIFPLLWAVFRFGPRGTATGILLLTGVAIWGTLQGSGPFLRVTPNESLFFLQAFLGVMALMAITVGGAISQHKKTEAELQKVQEGLERKVVERTREILSANAELRKSEERFRAFLESAPDAMVIVNREGRIIQVSAQTEELFGYTQEELLDNRVEMLVPEGFRQKHAEHREVFLANPRVRSMGEGVELFGLRKDGGLFPVDISLSPLQTEQGILVSAAIRDISRRKRSEEAMARLAAIVESSEDAIFSTDMEGLITSWNSAAERLFGYAAAEVRGKPVTLLDPPGHQQEAAQDLERLKRGERVRYEAKRMKKDRTPIDVWLTFFPVKDGAGRIVGFSAILRDIVEQKRAQQERQEKEILRAQVEELSRRTKEISTLNEVGEVLRSAVTLAEAYPVIPRFVRELFPTESGALYEFNETHNLLEAAVSWGDAPAQEDAFLPSECWALRRGQMHYVGTSSSELVCQHWKPLTSNSSFCIPLTARGKTFGLLRLLGAPHDNSWAAREDALGEYKQRLAKTVAQQISSALSDLRLQEILRYEATRDPLTGLFNRRHIEESLHRELYRAARKNTHVGFILFDLDRFKEFNDGFGHPAGDAVLRELSASVQKRTRADEILCRYGGEEFLLVLWDCSLGDLLRRAEELREGAKQLHLVHEGRTLEGITVSVGVALFPDHGKTLEELFQAADSALYVAKKAGRDRVIIADSIPWIVTPDRSPEREKGN
jgi:diguanylate cyclase (GGDEF)-like protein/PAS domain S-box-containing protein